MLAFLLSYLLLYKYVVIFAVVCSAAIIIPWPVTTMLLAVGAFSSQGYFNFWLSLIVAVVANIIGDLFDYWLTRTYGKAIIKNLYTKRISYFVRLEEYINNHAGLTIFFSRFVGVLDVVGSFLAGLIGMPLKIFLLYDFLGNLADYFLILSLGYIVGSYWQNFTSSLSLASGILFVSALIFILVRIFYVKNVIHQS